MNPWIDFPARYPPEETPVLVLFKGRYMVAELCWEYPTWEDNWNAYRYWKTEFGPEIEALDDVSKWQLIAEPNGELDKAAKAMVQAAVAFDARENHLANKRIRRRLMQEYTSQTGEYYEVDKHDPEEALDVEIQEAMAETKSSRLRACRELYKARKLYRETS